jgi:hypothetical protein
MNATGLQVPAEAVAAMGTHKRPPVLVNLNGYGYRSTVAAHGDVLMLPLSAEHREAAGVKAGDRIEVITELDAEPRTDAVPDDLAVALAVQPDVTAAFAALSYSAPRNTSARLSRRKPRRRGSGGSQQSSRS